jgi:putative nucleotidyltransferase with HDIG domain
MMRALAFAGLVFALLAVVLFPVLPRAVEVSPGQIAAQTVRAPRNISYNSDAIRAQLQDQAARSVREVVTYNVNAKSLQLARLTDIVNRMGSVRDAPGQTRSAKEDGLQRIPGLNLTASQRSTVLDLSPDGWRQVIDESVRVLGGILEEPFSAAELEDRRASVPARVAAGQTSAQGELVAALVKPLVVPTQQVDEAETQRARDRAVAAIGPQPVSYARNQVIVREGEPIDAAKLEALKQAGLLDVRVRGGDLLAVTLISLLASSTLGFYLLVLRPPSLSSTRRLALVAVLIGAVVLASKLYLPVVTPDNDHRYYAFALPVALAPLLVASLFEAPFAILIAVVLAVLSTFTAVYLPDASGVIGLSGSQPLQMTATYFFGGVAGVLAVQRAERLNRYVLAGAAVAAATFLSLAAFWAIDDLRARNDLLWMAGNAAAAGALTALLAVGLLAALGSLFDVTTRLQLMELAQLNAPLLRRLQEEAPGTFHHSIMVGNMAERAADKIGADSLLVRVGAYYHDIGKMGRPAFYIENQLGGENPHDRLDAGASAQIIQEHVRHGIELARRHRLPEQVRAFIPEHHGTRLVTYFYRIAAREDPDVDPARFRYPGPKPQSKETALVMLADSTEAIVRASQDRSQDRIDALVEAVISERVTEGEFDDCDITLRDLRVIAESFKSSLRAIYHPRIEYPAPAVSTAGLAAVEAAKPDEATKQVDIPTEAEAPNDDGSEEEEPSRPVEAGESDAPSAEIART